MQDHFGNGELHSPTLQRQYLFEWAPVQTPIVMIYWYLQDPFRQAEAVTF